ncbi:conserved hypothetical protein [Vibrio chagasii]|nr:conserved hypothetical protein [Vibrio chagasii]CAH7474413.1 conserved hypothetical protein [Vibrio chagasii]
MGRIEYESSIEPNCWHCQSDDYDMTDFKTEYGKISVVVTCNVCFAEWVLSYEVPRALMILQSDKTAYRERIQKIEQWSLNALHSQWLNKVDKSVEVKEETVERVVRDLGVTYPLEIFHLLPNYARLLVVEYLDWHGELSLQNLHRIEEELRKEAETTYDLGWFIDVILRERRIR